MDELYTHMKQFVDSPEAELLWRLARATCDKAKSTTDKAVRKDLMYDAFRAAEQALKAGDSNFACHKVFHFINFCQYCLSATAADCLFNWRVVLGPQAVSCIKSSWNRTFYWLPNQQC